jgi:hypothetical protein
MKFTKYNIKLFPVISNVHKAKTIRSYRFHHKAKRQCKPKGDDDPAGRELLSTIAFAAESTNSSKLGCFCFYGHSHKHPFQSGCFSKRPEDKPFFQRGGKLPAHYVPGIPVDNRHKVHESACHPDIGDVYAPDMIRVFWLYSPQQVRIGVVLVVPFAQIRPGRYPVYPHAPHQTQYPFPVCRNISVVQFFGDSPVSVMGPPGVDFINHMHDFYIRIRLLDRTVIDAGAIDFQEFRLFFDGDAFFIPVKHFFLVAF